MLSDLLMPGKNGRATVEELKAIKPELKALFMSGYTADLIAQRGILEQGLSFVQKPLKPAVLLKKIRETYTGAGGPEGQKPADAPPAPKK